MLPPAPAPRFDAHMHIDSGAIDARTEVVVPERVVRVQNNVDATTAVLEGAVRVEAPVEVTVPERDVAVTVAAPEPGPVRKRIETDESGRITAVIEERVS